MALNTSLLIAGKRGVFFTFTAVLLIMVILAAFTIGKQQLALTSRIPVIRTRATQANTYLRNLEASLLPRIVADSGHRALLAMVDYASEGNPILNANSTFTELLQDGKISGEPLSSSYMTDATFSDRFAEIAGLAQDAYGINTSYKLNLQSGNEFVLVQDNETGPWHVRAEFNITLLVNATLMSWNTTRFITVLLPIEGLLDPYYNLSSAMNPTGYQPVIRRAAVAENNWTLNNFMDHVQNVTYDHDVKAPDFLTRLANNALPGSGCCGIESLINPASDRMNFLEEFTMINNWSYVDHCFFGQQCNASKPNDKRLWNVSGFTTSNPGEDGYRFLLTLYYLGRYNLNQGELVIDE